MHPSRQPLPLLGGLAVPQHIILDVLLVLALPLPSGLIIFRGRIM